MALGKWGRGNSASDANTIEGAGEDGGAGALGKDKPSQNPWLYLPKCAKQPNEHTEDTSNGMQTSASGSPSSQLPYMKTVEL